MKFSSVSFLAAVFSSPLSTPLFGGSSSVVIVLLEMLAKMLLKMMLSSRFFLEIVLQAVSSHHAIIQVRALTHKLSQCAPPPRLHVTSLYCSKVGDLSLKCCHPSLQASSSSYHRRLKISILQCIHRLDLQSSRCFSSRHSSRDAPRVIPPSDAPPVVTAQVDPRGCAPPQCFKRLMICPSSIFVLLFGPLRRLKNSITDMYSSFGTPEYSRPLSPSSYVCITTHTSNQSLLHQSIPSVQMKFNSISIEEYESRLKVVSASAIVEAVKKESGREKREGKGRFLGAFSKADSLRETLLERKNKKPRKVRHWKPNEVEEADFNSSTALGRLNSTTSLLGRLGIEPSRTKVESFAADISGGIPCTKRNGEADVKCDGYYACDGINPDHVGCGSCNGQAACLFATGTVIGEESCNEFGACYKTSGAEIEDQSCNGVGACGLSPGIVVEEGSCNKSYEDDYAMCGLASGAHIGKESCLGHYGEVMLKISIVALINSLCVNISILPRFINHHSKLAPSGMDPKLAKVVVRAMNPVMLPFIMTRRRKDDTVMVQGATLAMDLAIIPGVVAPFGALLATTPAILFVPAILVGEQFMMVPVVALTAVIITLHAFLCEVELARIAAMSMKRVTIRLWDYLFLSSSHLIECRQEDTDFGAA
ncbi:predicted protein [Thalassiosira pseudonana CCMP1335]|uniref:DUF7640 domain-containing protein n=1 Tax=Thalassiosira pseudonana TaxID=35128 RepID=B8CFC1_THAPS|nr:predicted protein [Thalassiosira pseudonana CCMP1335]EED87774.1 predicted protein [Thalassiosira pseudonana CCMP1335]